METRFIIPGEDEPLKFGSYEEFIKYYKYVIKQFSVSQYEKAIYDRYVGYLEDSSDIDSEPFLIPEFRYRRLQKKHEYRLDFMVLNQYTEKYVGFEISPTSSHMVISGTKEKNRKKSMML